MNIKKLAILTATSFALFGISYFNFMAQSTPISGNSVTVTSVTPGTTASKLGKAEDVAHASGDTGVAALGVVTTSGVGTSATDGDYAALTLDSKGRQRVSWDLNVADGLSKFYVASATATGTTTLTAPASLSTLTISSGEASAMAYVRLYDKATAATESDTPVFTVCVGPGQSYDITWLRGFSLAAGLSIRASSSPGDSTAANGNTASTVKVVGTYK